MALDGLKPDIWSGRLLKRLNDILVYANVCNRDYEGEIRGYGDVVKINEIGTVTMNTYNATSTSALTVQFLDDAQKELKIDQSKYFAFWIDAVDQAQIKPKVMNAGMEQAAWTVRNDIDERIAARYIDAGLVAVGSRSGSTITGVNTTSTNILRTLSLLQQKLDENNTPQDGRWIVIPPWAAHKMVLAGIVLQTENTNILAEGKLPGKFYGFDIYVSNNVTNGTPAADDACIMAGYSGSISLAVQIVTTEVVKPAIYGGFKTLVKGLVVYGVKTVRPNNLAVAYLDYTAEAT